jgi:hypothetical protein
MDRAIIKKILEAGSQAPSGSNSQPWRFEVSDNVVAIHMIPEKDHRILNFKNRGTILANGCLIENISIAAEKFGYRTDVKPFPEGAGSNVVASLAFAQGASSYSPLYEAIFKRTTNRKPYSKESIPEEDHTALKDVFIDAGGEKIKVLFTESPAAMKELGIASSVNEVVMFENPLLRRLLFEEIAWTKEEETRRGGGLYLKTMELKPQQEIGLKLMKRAAPLRRLLNFRKVSGGIAGENAKIYASSFLMGIIVVEDTTDTAFLEAGRALQRIWLTATAHNMSFHLITGIFFLWQRFQEGNRHGFSDEHAALVKSAYEKVSSVFGATTGTIPLLFRIGYGGEPSARSMKKPPEIIFNETP